MRFTGKYRIEATDRLTRERGLVREYAAKFETEEEGRRRWVRAAELTGASGPDGLYDLDVFGARALADRFLARAWGGVVEPGQWRFTGYSFYRVDLVLDRSAVVSAYRGEAGIMKGTASIVDDILVTNRRVLELLESGAYTTDKVRRRYDVTQGGRRA